MRNAYQDAMDAVKAPDALTEKTLKLMFEEHKKLEAMAETGSGLTEIKAPSKKPRRIAHAALPAAACLCLCLLVIVPRLLSREANVDIASVDHSSIPSLAAPTRGVYYTDGFTESVEPTQSAEPTEGVEPTQSSIEALATDSLATRSGPATAYRETGTYQNKGEHVRLISLAYDEDGLCWVQCEVLYGNKLRRVYTGLKRFDAATFDLSSVPEENPLNHQAKVAATSRAMYGPGDGYDTYAELTVDKDQTVAVIAIENDYAQVEWTTSTQRYRAWVPTQMLNLL